MTTTALRSRTCRVRPLVAAALLAAVAAAPALPAPAAQAATTPVMTYQGSSVNMANVPATTVPIALTTSVKFDRGTYLLDGAAVGTLGGVTVNGTSYTGSGTVDLTGRTGSVALVAKLYSGKYQVQTVTKYLRVVPLDTTSIPAGYPDAATTGVPAGVQLTASTDLDVWEAGAVLDGLDIQGCLTVHAPDVTVRNSRITCDSEQLRAVSLVDAPGFVMEDSEIDGRGKAEVAIGWTGYTLRRVEVRGTHDGPRLGDDVTVEDSWVHDLVRADGVHTDGTQSTSGTGILVRHNTFDPRQAGSTDFLNAAVQLGTETGARLLGDVRFEDNFFNGGAYSVNVSCVANFSNVVFTRNRYGHGSRYGAVIAPAGIDFSTDTWADTRLPVPVKPACA
ncbi:right-handed parallel beta-helix repeat-containing protein [Kineococcus indalonis]|uniref:hypothetical protein n=1 Tax=Kineococcus indalonis TaxID=2696566 RepID=UPI001413441F|nr:hypothetical protein [Kineococcus indalonis]NAZ85238.1 hypothetical protein [Kineococcus indalonis]